MMTRRTSYSRSTTSSEAAVPSNGRGRSSPPSNDVNPFRRPLSRELVPVPSGVAILGPFFGGIGAPFGANGAVGFIGAAGFPTGFGGATGSLCIGNLPSLFKSALSGRSSASPRIKVIAACVWALTRPGISTCSASSMTS